MPLLVLVLLFLLLAPLVELYLLIRVGSQIGALPTILLSLFTAVLGVYLVRLQGFAVLSRIAGAMERREAVAAELIDGALLLVAGLCLLIPGFATDTLGFLLLLPLLRRSLARVVLHRLALREAASERPGPDPHRIIEGDFRRDD